MPIARDNFTSTGTFTTSKTTSHTVIGTPRAVIVYVISNGTANEVSGVTYGGVAMTQVVNFVTTHAGTNARIHWFFLGTGVPAAPRTTSSPARRRPWPSSAAARR